MDSGTPSPQHGDYQRPMMTLTLWTDGTLSLLMPIGYDEVHVDTTKSRIREKSQGRKQANQSKAKKIKLSIGHLFEKNGIHYVEKFGTKFTQPRLSVLTYYEDEEVSLADIIAEVNQMMPAMREHVRSKYPKVEGTIYDFADIEQDVADKGFLRYRRNAPDVPSRNPVYYMSSGLDLPSSDHFKVDPSLTEGGDRPHVSYESATDYRNESIRRVHDLTNNELKDKMKSSGMEGFLDAPDPVQFKTMRTAAGKIDLWHSTGMQVSNGQLQVLDVHYIRCIDDDWGPYKGEANSGAQISGEDWYNELTVVEQKYVRALHLKYCHLPPWMISPSMHRAVSKHFTKKEDLHSQCIYGGPSFGQSHLFHRFKAGRYTYVSNLRHSTWKIPCSVTKEVGFSAVGGNIQGCEQLGKAFLPYRVDDIVEVKYDNYETFLLESGCTLTKVLEGGKFCVPAEVHIKEEDKTRQERHEEIVKEVLAKAKARSKSSGKKHKPKKRASSGKKKGAKSQDDIDDLSEEEIPEPKECAPAKKAAASGKKKRQADSDSYYDNQLMGTQSSKAPARATASRARSTAKKPKYNYDDEDDDDDFVDEPPATKSKGRATASRARSTAKKPKYTDDEDEMEEDGNEGEEEWDLIEVIAVKDLKKKKPKRCQEEGCTSAACSVWASNLAPDDEWYGCIDCMENYYEGWPSSDEMPVKHLTEEHRKLLAEKCSERENPPMPDLPTTMPLLATAGGNDAANIKARIDGQRN